MKKLLIGFLAVTLVMSFSVADAAPLQYVNVRPVPIGSTWDNPATQQLSQLLPMFNVVTDQQAAGYWKLGGINPTTAPRVSFEITANSATLQMGIFSDINGDTDAAGRTLVDIFLGPATAGTAALITFSGGTMTIAGAAGAVNNGTFSGITASGFGFYIQPNGDSGSTFYSLDQLNGGLAQMVAYREIGENRWTLGFEDLANTGVPGATDGDFNDFIFQIESITQVPEPLTLILLGSGLLGLAAIRRKK
jgi:hypothetical protein